MIPLLLIGFYSTGFLMEPKVLVGGNDFYAFPHVDPKVERIAWIKWCPPDCTQNKHMKDGEAHYFLTCLEKLFPNMDGSFETLTQVETFVIETEACAVDSQKTRVQANPIKSKISQLEGIRFIFKYF
ncbi:hypothetical protein PVL29_011950 [Vitis rotundifolia]|uniref:Uncharacterized protein n=1 Tax=Vitis rotundifolia TaxID=103349 RepID=A0AA39DQ81_VITRO|nr:hypothetical protein PVL29_011950 [Vitis rotundifolia]